MSRDAAIERFLAAAGWDRAARIPLAGDASRRRYVRLVAGPGRTAMLMDAPPEHGEDTRPFVEIARHLAAMGLSAPEILAWDATVGLVLCEDFGDALLARLAAAEPARIPALYEAAVDTLIALHRHPVPAGIAPYAPEEMGRLAALAVAWYLPGAEGRRDPGGADRLAEELTRLLRRHAPGHGVLALRDYHAENLIWLPEREGPCRIGLLDFQDARAGHPAYDLVSLTEDARRDVEPLLQQALIARYVALTGADPEPFHAACAVLAAQRNLRILGVFARLSLHYDKPGYVDLIPRVWGHLRQDLEHPAIAPMKLLVLSLLPEPTPARLDKIRAARGTWPTP